MSSEESFICSCEKGDLSDAQLFFGYIKNSNTIKKTLQTGFNACCDGGWFELAKWIVSLRPYSIFFLPCYIDLRYDNDKSFIAVCKGGYTDMVNWFIKKIGTDPIKTNNYEAFREACLHGCYDIVQILYQHISATNINNLITMDLIKECCKVDSVETIMWLNEKIKQIPNNDFWSYCFYVTCHNGCIETVKWLYFSKITHNNNYVKELFDNFTVAFDNNHVNVVKWIQSLGKIKLDIHNLLHKAIDKNYKDIVRWLAYPPIENITKDPLLLQKLLEYVCCNLKDIDYADDIISSIHNFDGLDFEYLFHVLCVTGRFDMAKFIYSKRKINIRTYNDDEFDVCCSITINGIPKFIDEGRFDFPDIYKKYSFQSVENFKELAWWLSTLCSDYTLSFDESNNICDYNIETCFKKANSYFTKGNIEKAITILGIKKNNNLKHVEDCIICLSKCNNPIKFNCGHIFGFDCMMMWLANKGKKLCILCNKRINFSKSEINLCVNAKII